MRSLAAASVPPTVKGRFRSGQTGQTVNLLALRLRWFESSPAQFLSKRTRPGFFSGGGVCSISYARAISVSETFRDVFPFPSPTWKADGAVLSIFSQLSGA